MKHGILQPSLVSSGKYSAPDPRFTWITVPQAAYVAGVTTIDMCDILATIGVIDHVGIPGDALCRVNYQSLLSWAGLKPFTLPLPLQTIVNSSDVSSSLGDVHTPGKGMPLFLSY